MRVFIENPAGSLVKYCYNEKTLELLGTEPVSCPYPFPYGFVLDTTAEDGDNADCFVLTRSELRTGSIVECAPVGLMEQVEDGEVDHKILAALAGESPAPILQAELKDFAQHVFDHIQGKVMIVGRFRDRDAALEYLRQCQRNVQEAASS